MSLIGTLEQFRLSHVLQRVEAHEKTGLLVVKQSPYWVEFYFRDGRLLCIGPLRTRASLGERLVRERLIAPQVLLDLKLSLSDAEQSETRVALALMEGGYISRDDLRAWTIRKTTDALSAILSWSSGEIYFEDGTQPPADRLLVSMSVSSIIDAIPQPSSPTQPAQLSWTGPNSSVTHPPLSSDVTSTSVRYLSSSSPHLPVLPSSQPVSSSTPSPAIDRVPTLTGTVQFMSETGRSSLEAAGAQNTKQTDAFLNEAGSADSFLNDSNLANKGNGPQDAGFLSAASLIESFPADALPATESLSSSSLFSAPNTEDFLLSEPMESDAKFATLAGPETPAPVASSVTAIPVMQPVPPKRVDTSFMQPDMVLYPTDLSSFRDQNPHIQITPDQWRLLMCVDGQTSLQTACRILAFPPEAICQLAGELLAEGLIRVALPQQVSSPDVSPMSQELAASGLNNGYVVPGYTATPAAPWSASVPGLPIADVAPQYTASLPFETESQWGNGGNGATFVPGRGWVTTPQPLQPLQSGEQMPSSSSPNNFVYAGNGSY